MNSITRDPYVVNHISGPIISRSLTHYDYSQHPNTDKKLQATRLLRFDPLGHSNDEMMNTKHRNRLVSS